VNRRQGSASRRATSAALEARHQTLQTLVLGTIGRHRPDPHRGRRVLFLVGRFKDLRVIHEVRPNAIHTPATWFQLGEFLVNLAEPDHYIKTTVVFFSTKKNT